MLILKLVILLTVANGTPVIAKRVLGGRFSYPLDAGASFVDGQPLFGPSKTVRGVLFSVLVTTAVAPLLGLEWKIGALVGVSAMLGDLLSRFAKRRMKRPSSSMALGIDQVPESLLPLLACQNMLSLSISDIVAGVALFFVIELSLSRLLYRWHIRDHPY
jgi:CDP-2,3-bis-(O-geranylgeranyl)-sn-glycerol synthase